MIMLKRYDYIYKYFLEAGPGSHTNVTYFMCLYCMFWNMYCWPIHFNDRG